MSSNAADKVKVVAGYALQQKLGSGSFATVYRGVRLPQTQSALENVAIKAITRTSEKLTKKVLQNLEIEIEILRTYRHPNIVCLHNVQKTERHYYLILEYCGGGDVQGLIRRRKSGRLSEGLTRRLVRDLAAGLKFLWAQELIHRDIKPQNLLLTGPLPLDEVNDPEKTDELERLRRQTNFPSANFSLKIADFGFARHLQTTSLAETLCGSPLYMAPEILQHHRYDAKADLWSVGTVLFEMICGRPPFNGENHIDLLRNIQRKAVRLPADVRVSKECVNLLRLLLNRNPLSRAGFKEFFEACDAFVALGCNGEVCTTVSEANIDPQPAVPVDGAAVPTGSESLHTVATTASHHVQNQETAQGGPGGSSNETPLPLAQPSTTPMVTNSEVPAHIGTLSRPQTQLPYGGLTPLVSSPPLMSKSPVLQVPSIIATNVTRPTTLNPLDPSSQQTRRSDGSSSAENSFVMVEHVASLNISPNAAAQTSAAHDLGAQHTFFGQRPAAPRGDYMVMNKAKGMLSTSPGTGGALMGMITGRARLIQTAPQTGKTFEAQIADSTKVLAASEDVGRRAISVAHLGDSRAYSGMRMAQWNDSEASSLLSTTQMEGIVEEADESGTVTDDGSDSTEVMAVSRRRSSTDKSMQEARITDELDEMPFALNAESTPLMGASNMPTRESNTISKGASITSARPNPKPSVTTIRSHYQEALQCYLKTLKMLKSSVTATQRVSKDLEALSAIGLTMEQQTLLQRTVRRYTITSEWLTEQFNGVLERANAANLEIRKFPVQAGVEKATTGVEELIYNASLACGREGAVKHLLGQNEAARNSYRSAGLLAETLMMESGLGGEDRKVLEEYVDGFAARITELDQTMLQQSRMAISGASGSAVSSRRAPSVIGLVGQPQPAPHGLHMTPPQL